MARPKSLPDGTVNLMVWNCVVPGQQGTDWEGGHYPITLHCCEDYLSMPPKCKFPPTFDPNVFPSGMGWHESITVRQILLGIQGLLHQPNPEDPAQEAHKLFVKYPEEYKLRVLGQAKQYPPVV